MAMQAGFSLSRIIILAGAGYTGTVMFQKGKLSDLIGELQALVKGWEKSGEHSDGDSDYSDAIAQQVKRLAMEVRQLASARQITVLNGDGRMGNVGNLIVPAATIGALGYGYMWWKGLKFSDLMYVTKRGMANAVSNLTKHLDQVTEALSAAKAHLTQRIQHLDDKMESQKEISREIQAMVDDASTNISHIELNLLQLQNLVGALDGKIEGLEEKQDLANIGIFHLLQIARVENEQVPKLLEDELKRVGKNRFLQYSQLSTGSGLKGFFEDISQPTSAPSDRLMLENGTGKLTQSPSIDQQKPLFRYKSVKC